MQDRRDTEELAGRGRGHADPEGEELRRLLQDVATELRKLDEGLRLVSAYLVRLKAQAERRSGRTVH